MANTRWKGNAQDRPQVNTITPTASNAAVYTITINGKSVTYTADASATVTEIVEGLVAACTAASAPAEFAEVEWEENDAVVTATAKTPGKPFTQTSSASAGALTTSTTTTSISSHDWSVAANWDTGAVPITGDDVFIDNTDIDILYGLAQSAVTLASLTIAQSFTGSIGLPEWTGTYVEYQNLYLAIGATLLTIGAGPGQGSGRIKINCGSVQTAITVLNTGSPEENDREALLWKGTHASNAMVVDGGSVGVAIFGGETATLTTLRINQGTAGQSLAAAVRCGAGVTLATVTKNAGTLTLNTTATTITNYAGDVYQLAGNLTTLTMHSGTFYYQGVGTITTLSLSGGATADFSQDVRGRTITNLNMYEGSGLLDPSKSVTFSNGIVTVGVDPGELRLVLGKGRTITPS